MKRTAQLPGRSEPRESPNRSKTVRQDISYYVAAAVSLLTLVVYLPALRNGFVNWDDNEFVLDNLHIRSLDWNFLKWAFSDLSVGLWHPLTWISYAVDYAVWGMNPMGFHLTAILLHAINTFLVVYLVVRLLEAANDSALQQGGIENYPSSFLTNQGVLITAGATGLLFGLQPLHVESVAWVSERKDLLCALFFLLSILAYTNFAAALGNKDDQNNNSMIRISLMTNKWYLLSLALFIIAISAKTMAVSLPVVLLILDWYPYRRLQSRRNIVSLAIEKIPFIAVSLLISIVSIFAQNTIGAMGLMEAMSLSTRVLVACRALMIYLWKMIVPLNLNPFYPYPESVHLFSIEYLSAIGLITGITTVSAFVARKQRLWLCAWIYFVLTLLPVLGIIQVGSQSMADRYTYLPSLGPFLIVGLITANIYGRVIHSDRRREILRSVCFSIALAIFVFLSYATVKQIGVWKDSIVFWNYVLEKEPSAPIAHYSLGLAYKNQGLFDEAIEQFRTALTLKPNYPEVHYNLGLAYAHEGLPDLAIDHFQTALGQKPDYAEASNSLGVAYSRKALPDLAIEQFRTALRLKPDYAEVHVNLGIAYKNQGLIDLAIEQFRVAVSLKPDYAEAHFNLGVAYMNKGPKDMAKSEFELGLKIKPDDYRAQQLLDLLNAGK